MDFLEPGELVADRFQVEALRAVGGSSLVYRARDLATHENVALKVLALRDATTYQRFRQEVTILSSLAHPSIVRYVAKGTTPRHSLFLAMEWLAGEDLANRLMRKGLCASDCLKLVRQLCQALAAAHDQGVLHRDIKPSNVFLVGGSISHVKLLDFGIARPRDAVSALTLAGSLVGTVGYMSPEQVRSSVDLDQRSDVFALGCLLFECLTGQHPFAAEHDVAVVTRVLCEEPSPIATLRPELGQVFQTLMLRLLAKSPDDRPADVMQALAEIEEAFGSAQLDDRTVPARPRSDGQADPRIVSVVAVRREAQQQPDANASADVQLLAWLARDAGADLIRIRAKTWLMIFRATPHSTPSDQAAHAARSALRASQNAAFELTVATGPVDRSGQRPLGAAVDGALSMLNQRTSTIPVDALTAGLLGGKFNIRRSSHGLLLEGEAEDPGVGVLMGRGTPFVGRAKELAILGASLQQCLADEVARGVLLVGPSGAGKSRLGREFIEKVKHDSAASVMISRSDPTTACSPLDLVQRLLRHAAELRAGTSLDQQRSAFDCYLSATLGDHSDAQLCAFLGELVGIPPRQPVSGVHRAARSDADVMREQKRRAFVRWLEVLVSKGPLILFLDDVQWADPPSLQCIQEAIRALNARALFIIATARPELDQLFPRMREQLDLEELRVGGLSKKASEHFAQAVLPAQTPATVISRVVSLSGGNAFYLEELVRRVAEGSTELPETIVAMAQSRIERLAPEARRVLRAASVFGETVPAEGIEKLLPETLDIRQLLDRLVSEEILQIRADGLETAQREYAFRHALLREAAYEMLSDADRRTTHLRAAEWLETRPERDAPVLADHFERGGAIERALPWIAKASMGALESGDLLNARELSRRGARSNASGELRGQLLLIGAYASIWMSVPELPVEALSLLPRATAPWWLALSLHLFGANFLGKPELAKPYIQLALDTPPDVQLSGAFGHALQTFATGVVLIGEGDIGWTIVNQFDTAARVSAAACDPVFLAWFNVSKCVLASNWQIDGHWCLGQALDWGHTAIATMSALGFASGEAVACFHTGNAHWLAGDFEQAIELVRRAYALGERTGNMLVTEHASLLLAISEMRSGSRSAALDMITALSRSANRQLAHSASVVLAECAWREGRLDEAIERAQAAAIGCALIYRRTALALLARAYLARQDFQMALAMTERAFADGGTTAFPHLNVDLLGSRAAALRGLGAEWDALQTINAATAFRDDVAQGITESINPEGFKARGRANRVLDELVRSSESHHA
ncbi:MAG TPA: protein kinase [Polyangiales bacterium]|nr:protein kinase [Polyangiales bacterium]